MFQTAELGASLSAGFITSVLTELRLSGFREDGRKVKQYRLDFGQVNSMLYMILKFKKKASSSCLVVMFKIHFASLLPQILNLI